MTTKLGFRNDLTALAAEIAPLYCKYDGQTQPQPAYIAIGLEDGAVFASYSGEIGNAVPESVWLGRVRRYSVSPYASGKALAALLGSDEFQSLAARIVDGGSTEWDGNNMIGTLNEDAEAADTALDTLLEGEFSFDGDSLSAIWDGDYLLSGCDLFDYWPEGKSLDEAVSEMEAGAQSEGAYLDVDARDFLLEAASRYVDGQLGRLGQVHIDTLIAEGWKLDEDDLEEWREARSAQ